MKKFAKKGEIPYNFIDMKQIKLFFSSLFFLVLATSGTLSAQYSSKLIQESFSLQEMEAGIALFNERRYAAAIQAFEQALAYEPLNHAARYRLGLAYLHAGYAQNAAASWEALVSAGVADYQVVSKLNELYYHMSMDKGYRPPPAYVFTGYYDGFTQAAHTLLRSSFIAYDRAADRKFISSFGTGLVLELDGLNGIRQKYGSRFLWSPRMKNPTGIAVLSNSIYVADFALDKIFVFNRDIVGSYETSFGEKGAGYGQLSGVMGLAFGADGYLYVVNGGNARIDRFTAEGTYVSSFGEGRLFRPTDIIIEDNTIFVSDITGSGLGRVLEFDGDGIFRREIGTDILRQPRGLFLDGSILYISDAKLGLQLYDRVQNTFQGFVVGDDRLAYPFDVIKDKDGVIVRTDFNTQVMGIYAPAPVLYANLSVDLVQVNTENYPYIYSLLRVRNRDGTPLTGLNAEEFTVKEFNAPVDRPVIKGTEVYREKLLLNFVIDGSQAAQAYLPQMEYFFKSIVSNLNGDDRMQISVADETPARMAAENANALRTWDFITNRQARMPEAQAMDTLIYDDIGSLFNNLRNRALIIFTEGGGDLNASYGPDVLSLYAERNSIPLYVINLSGKNENQWRRLAEFTHGAYFDAKKDAAKIIGLAQTIRTSPPLEYLIEYQSTPVPAVKTWIDLIIDIDRAGITGRVIDGYYRPITVAKPVDLQESFFGKPKK